MDVLLSVFKCVCLFFLKQNKTVKNAFQVNASCIWLSGHPEAQTVMFDPAKKVDENFVQTGQTRKLFFVFGEFQGIHAVQKEKEINLFI